MMVTLAVIVMVGYIVYNAFTMILAGGENEQQITNAKKRIIFSITGMVILISIKPLRDLFTAADGRIQVANSYRLIDLIAKWGNYLLGLIAVAAVIGLLYAGVRLIINFGDENAMQNAKKIMIACGIGLLLAFSAWTIVNQFASPVSL
ncbi:MAG: pilin [Candidatus Gracilibacteria bacterium]|nr:pilin [Candidatus Gracilibacteria bacterium]